MLINLWKIKNIKSDSKMKIPLALSNLILFFYLQMVITEVIGQKCKAENREPWSYKGRFNGPRRWRKRFPMCGGRSQSPIDIDTDAVKSSDLEPLELMGYDRDLTKVVVENNGHTAEVTPRDRILRYIEIEGKQYSLRQFHFHWSEEEGEGSEHALDSTRFNMEAHFVHTSDDNKTAVVGVLYEVSDGDQNDALQEIVNVLPRIRYKDQRTYFKGSINLEDFFPENPASFYRYQGSLTTPPCTEGVTWFVVKTVMRIREDQLSEFLKLYAVPKNEAGPGCRITTNVRPLQKINGRTVYDST